MAPSRGTAHPHVPTPTSDHGDTAVVQQGNTALLNAKRNLNYLFSPTTSKDQPRFRTRALLRTLRYISQFVFWRVVRWAKYAAIGALTAGIAATAFGSVITGAAWVAAPMGIGGGVTASVIWGMGKYIAKKAHNKWKRTGGDAGVVAREKMQDSPVRSEGAYGLDVGPDAMAW